MNVREFQQNRARFSWEDLRQYDGQWVAFSADGSQIVANHADLLELNSLVQAAGEDPEKVGLEWIQPPDDCFLGGASY